MITIVTNALGSGDWTIVMKDTEVIFAGHRITPLDLRNIIHTLTGSPTNYIEAEDEDMLQY
jgi:hypothetical protein